jgi:uncharacterized protein (DUF305 family)
MPPRRLIIAAAAGVGAVVLAVLIGIQLAKGDPDPAAGPRIVQPGAPGQAGRTLSPEELAKLSPPAHNGADTAFMQRMIPHHAQALEMTALVEGRSQSADVPLLAERIEISQRDEIAQMQRWLTDRGLAVPTPHANHPGHDTLMPGMLNDHQLAQLEQARGAEFDRLFLQLMIRHHEGALVMVQELYASGGGLEPASDRFAREVNADQNIEINRMRDILAKLT